MAGCCSGGRDTVDHSSTLTSLQKALTGSRTPGGLDVLYTKLAVDLQSLDDGHRRAAIAEYS